MGFPDTLRYLSNWFSFGISPTMISCMFGTICVLQLKQKESHDWAVAYAHHLQRASHIIVFILVWKLHIWYIGFIYYDPCMLRRPFLQKVLLSLCLLNKNHVSKDVSVMVRLISFFAHARIIFLKSNSKFLSFILLLFY